MRKQILALASLVCALVLFVQPSSAQNQTYPQAPDNEAIREATMNPASPYYYPALFMRYSNGDMNLTLEDFRYLYYGYAFRPTYQPLQAVPATDRILMILEANPNPSETDYRNIIANANEVMRSEPFNPSTLNFLTYAYGMLGDTINERINAYRLNMVLETIESSGTGLTESSPWHVLHFSHPLDLYSTKNWLVNKRLVVSRNVEFIGLLEPQGKIKGYYFDYGRIYWNKPSDYKGKKSNGLQFNGITIKKRE